VVQVRDRSGIVFSTALGFAHRAEAIPNVPSTRFGTATGTQTFTALGVCQLIHYNNGGFVLLGLVIEAVSGMAYTDSVEQHVLARAGMLDSGFFEMNDLPPRTAYGYLRDGRTNIYEVPIRVMPDGGCGPRCRIRLLTLPVRADRADGAGQQRGRCLAAVRSLEATACGVSVAAAGTCLTL